VRLVLSTRVGPAEPARASTLLGGEHGRYQRRVNDNLPSLQVGGQVERFRDHVAQPIKSPAVIPKIGNWVPLRRGRLAKGHRIPIQNLKKPDRTRWDARKLDHVRPVWSGPSNEQRRCR
jgi:hypothetical protein